jgi:hypothetical protein
LFTFAPYSSKVFYYREIPFERPPPEGPVTGTFRILILRSDRKDLICQCQYNNISATQRREHEKGYKNYIVKKELPCLSMSGEDW